MQAHTNEIHLFSKINNSIKYTTDCTEINANTHEVVLFSAIKAV